MKASKSFVLLLASAIVLASLASCSDGVVPSTDSSSSQESSANAETHVSNQYTIVFDYNDGSGKSETKTVFSGMLLKNCAPELDSLDMDFVGWSTSPTGTSMFDGTIHENLTLYAIWAPVDEASIKTYASAVPGTIEDTRVIIDGTKQSLSFYNDTIRIAPSVKQITLKGNANSAYRVSINVLNRTTDLIINLESFQFEAVGTHAINAFNDSNQGSDYTLTVNVAGKNLIRNTSANGAACIKAINLVINGSGTLEIFGSDGTTGENGASVGHDNDGNPGSAGSNGSDAVQAASVRIDDATVKVTAGNGGNGGNGSNGSNSQGWNPFDPSDGKFHRGGAGASGGNGGNAIVAPTVELNNCMLTAVAGNGGNGGKGGNGAGTNVTTAGSAGDGGRGGNGGNVFIGGVNLIKNDCTISPTAGKGGTGGSGGSDKTLNNGGSAGSHGSGGSVNG